MINTWQKFKENTLLRRFVVLLVLIVVLYQMQAMMNTILLTFIFTYLIVNLIKRVQRCFPRLPAGLIVAVTYSVIVLALYFAITIYFPVLFKQITKMFKSVIDYYEGNDMTGFMHYISQYVSRSELITQAKNGMGIMVRTLTSVGHLTVAIFISLILSFFYTIELKQMHEFSSLFVKHGILKLFFQDVYYFGRKFTNTFGVVLEAQFFIALCNTALTLICLAFMRMPQILALGLMVFLLSLVPVAGVIISLIPLSIIAYSVGGLHYVFYIFIMILVIHTLEAYVLNPKFMSSKTELPVFYTFLVLLVAEHFFGTWGLIVGVPIFTFLLDILDIKSSEPKKKQVNR